MDYPGGKGGVFQRLINLMPSHEVYPDKLHDYHYLGDTFKERERIKLRSKRWIRKLKSMPVLERHALLSAIHDWSSKVKPEKNLFQDCL